jgi:hypothetical protein
MPSWKASGTIGEFRLWLRMKKLKPQKADWVQIERFLASADR